ncbi:MAG: hypothetical protein ABJP48_12235 [Erythrobacter sp.]|uniref:hypothetical protein n=1 Tax=Marinobacter alexandrii TaxID=2570351 RepID=UPI00329A115A
MDTRRQHLTILLGAFALCGGALAQSAGGALREASWLSDEGRLEALSSEPISPHLSAANPEAERRIRLGQSLFKTPFLFGGQAARAGLSCHSCHVNGRDNPSFQFPMVSGAPGTADVTSSFFSESLGNGVFDPTPIPDLAVPGKVSHDRDNAELEDFIQTIIVQEFSGSPPPPEVIEALASYIRALQSDANAQVDQRVARSIASDLGEVDLMIAQAADTLFDGGEQKMEIARLLISGARHRLSLVHERMVAPRHQEHRDWLVRRSRALGEFLSGRLEGKPNFDAAIEELGVWRHAFADRGEFAAIENATLYNRELLSAHLGD